MKETEITFQIFNPLEEAITILKNQGYEEIKRTIMDDHYFTSLPSIASKCYADIIKKSVLLRSFNGKDKQHLLIYKNKEYDSQGNVICEEKVNCKVEDIYSVKKILKLAGFNNFININTLILVLKKDNIEFALQKVKGLGLFIEIEEFDYMKNLSPQEKIKELTKVAKSLGLNIGSDYNCKKVQMMLKK